MAGVTLGEIEEARRKDALYRGDQYAPMPIAGGPVVPAPPEGIPGLGAMYGQQPMDVEGLPGVPLRGGMDLPGGAPPPRFNMMAPENFPPGQAANIQAALEKSGVRPPSAYKTATEQTEDPTAAPGSLVSYQPTRSEGPVIFNAPAAGPKPNTGPLMARQKAAYGEIESGMRGQGAAQAGVVDVERMNRVQKQDLFDQLRGSMEHQQVVDQAQELERQKMADAGLKKLQAENDAVRSTVIDPNHLWESRSTEQKVMVSIAMGLGALGQSLGAGPNAALSIFNQAIDRDIDAQVKNLGNRRQSLEQSQSLYAQNLKNLGDGKAARQATRSQMLDLYKLQVDNFATQSDSAAVIAKAEVLKSRADEEIGKLHLSIVNDEYKRMMAAAAATAAAPPPMSKEERDSYVPGYGIFHNVEDKKEFIKRSTAAKEMQFLVEKGKAERGKISGADLINPHSAAYKKLDSISKQIIAKQYKAQDLGAPSAGDTTLALGEVGGGFTAVTGDPGAVMQDFVDNTLHFVKQFAETAGYDKVQRGYVVNRKTKQMLPAVKYQGGEVGPNTAPPVQINPVQPMRR